MLREIEAMAEEVIEYLHDLQHRVEQLTFITIILTMVVIINTIILACLYTCVQ